MNILPAYDASQSISAEVTKLSSSDNMSDYVTSHLRY